MINIAASLYGLYAGLWTTLTSRYPVGQNVFEYDWDVLILLDTCRVDAIKEVRPEYEFITDVEKVMSVGSSSNEFIANTFTTEYASEIADTVYVTANGHTDKVLRTKEYPEVHIGEPREPPNLVKDRTVGMDQFKSIEELWRHAPKDSIGHTPPEIVTDRAISVGRTTDVKRLIVHYSQPHAPYVLAAEANGRPIKEYEENPFEALRNGVSRELIWNSYLEELRAVLDSVRLLLENLDAPRVTISSDHGEAFGELGAYGHLPGLIHPHVKWVPWVVTEAIDKNTHSPDTHNTVTTSTKEHLEELGYY